MFCATFLSSESSRRLDARLLNKKASILWQKKKITKQNLARLKANFWLREVAGGGKRKKNFRTFIFSARENIQGEGREQKELLRHPCVLICSVATAALMSIR